VAFQPFGNRKKQLTTDLDPNTDLAMATFETTTDGFTGHEMLDDFGLIHMNGRVYDPQIGRFLSADPFVQAPENSQSYNRYSYVMNNPLSLVDPSGYFFSPIDFGFDNDVNLGDVDVLGNSNIIDANLTLWQAQLDQTLGTDLLGRYDTGQTYTNYELETLPIAFEAKFNHDKSFRDGWLQENTQVFEAEPLPQYTKPAYYDIGNPVTFNSSVNDQIDRQWSNYHGVSVHDYRTTTVADVGNLALTTTSIMSVPGLVSGFSRHVLMRSVDKDMKSTLDLYDTFTLRLAVTGGAFAGGPEGALEEYVKHKTPELIGRGLGNEAGHAAGSVIWGWGL